MLVILMANLRKNYANKDLMEEVGRKKEKQGTGSDQGITEAAGCDLQLP